MARVPYALTVTSTFLTFSFGQTVHAQTAAYDQCGKVLEGDLFNKVTAEAKDSSAAAQQQWSTFLSMSEDEAYSMYEKQYESSKGTGGGGGISYAGIGLSG